MSRYNPKEIEPKWQKIWEDQGIYVVDFDSPKPKFVGFGMFNYPSGAGIHVGHARNFTIPDVITRVKRQQGFEAYQPVGWDSFGLPAENYAIKTGVAPQESTKTAIAKYYDQYRAMGWAVDWTKEISTADPKYYKWTQWCFSKLFEHGLAYQKESAQWWCEFDKTVLADEQVETGKCWRCGNPVVKKSLKQWFFKITDYADEMLEATDSLDWTPSVKASQKAWIGRSVGAEIDFVVEGVQKKIKVFTTRVDTLFSAAFLVLAPEHPLVAIITTDEQKEAIDKYVSNTLQKTEVQRQQDADKEKTGAFTGAYAVNPANDETIPIWIADFVLAGYGTGAVFGDIHDERDWEFAQKFDIPTRVTLVPEDPVEAEKVKNKEYCFHDEGVLIDSGEFTGLRSEAAREKITQWLEKEKAGREKVNYKMRDWLVSRQRYWGAPIPIIHCPKDGAVAVPEKDLPVELPEIANYQPTGGNTSVLAGVETWVNTTCPKCGGPAKRETDTMDGYICSSWYFLRYLDPMNNQQAWNPEQVSKWMPIDFYNGADHATAHLLYARFFTRFFHKLGLVNTPEPFKKMVFNGKIKAHDGAAFSKSKGNGIDPLEVIGQGYGADSIRLYEMFAAPVEFDVLWDQQGIPGTYRFLNRIWVLVQEHLKQTKNTNNQSQVKELQRAVHAATKKVTEDLSDMSFNTAIAAQMELVNELYKLKTMMPLGSKEWQEALATLLQLVAPFAPHIAEELWHQLGHTDTIHIDHWPTWDESLLARDIITIVVQVNGKVRANIEIAASASAEQVLEAAKADQRAANYLKGQKIKKEVYVPKKLVNFVV